MKVIFRSLFFIAISLLFNSCSTPELSYEDRMLGEMKKMGMGQNLITDEEFYSQKEKDFYFCSEQDQKQQLVDTQAFLCLSNQTAKLFRLQEIQSNSNSSEWCWSQIDKNPVGLGCLGRQDGTKHARVQYYFSNVSSKLREDIQQAKLYFKNKVTLEKTILCLRKLAAKCPQIEIIVGEEYAGGKLLEASKCVLNIGKKNKCF